MAEQYRTPQTRGRLGCTSNLLAAWNKRLRAPPLQDRVCTKVRKKKDIAPPGFTICHKPVKLAEKPHRLPLSLKRGNGEDQTPIAYHVPRGSPRYRVPRPWRGAIPQTGAYAGCPQSIKARGCQVTGTLENNQWPTALSIKRADSFQAENHTRKD